MLMVLSVVTVPSFAEEAENVEVVEGVVVDNNLVEPFDVTYEEEVDAGLFPYDENTVLVKTKKKTNEIDADCIASIEYLFEAKDGYWYTANLSEGTTVKEAISKLRSTDEVLLAEYNFMYEAGATTLSDGKGIDKDVQKNPKHQDQWHLDSCGFQKAWEKMKNDKKNPGGDSGVIVAVIDTGVDYDHEDLKNNMWTNEGEIPGDGIDNDKNGYVDDYYGVDIVAKKGNGDDDHGHGTHVAGIIAAANNNVGVVGIAYNTKIMAIKAGQASGYFLQNDICKAIDYARENGADVINMSFGGSASTIAVQDALEAAYTHSVLVAAAGNDGLPNENYLGNTKQVLPCYPAAYSFVLGVMAVDDYGVESSFTNYDGIAFNSVEYELYAPGNAITSTIPNDRYATWNGTSMAAPIVSGMAAVLRSYFDDPDMYPTKFIYGQLASTSERSAECLDPDLHGIHNLPQIANLYDALTKLPKPELSVSDYTVFDTKDIDDNNNGDGTIDAGEVVALGFELRNRWGMSEETIVTIDALSQADIPNPYVEFSSDGEDYGDSASVDYGSVGTYSTQDCGKIMEDDLWTGWENPFYVKVKKDAPNDTILKINVTIECKNGIDKNDDTIYRFGEYPPITIELIVKNGVVLPQIIDEDMVLTKDNYYIIPNQTVIEEGVTVTVTEGTSIQFWTSDKNDAYADSYIASLLVKGKLECIGTEEEPVKIFPSDLMGNYRVEIYEQGNGEIYYTHTTITNLHTGYHYGEYHGFIKAENCEFNVNYKDELYGRYLEGGQVKSSSRAQFIYGGYAKNCAFYKIGSDSSYYAARINVATCEGCIFVDSFIDFDEAATYKNCVFYGNNNYWDSEKYGGTSSMGPYAHYYDYAEVMETVRDEVTGETYLQVKLLSLNGYYEEYIVETLEMMNLLAEYMGGSLVYIETEEELEFLKNSGVSGMLGAQLNKKDKFEWMNGEPLGDFVEIYNPSSTDKTIMLLNKRIEKGDYFSTGGKTVRAAIIELPGEIDVEEITLKDEAISVDTAVNYQLAPSIYPSTAIDGKLLYFSSNEAVATVDEEGLVTPVTTGVATIYVFSEDMQVNASMEIEVVDEVKAESILVPKKMQINIGEEAELNAQVYPANSTKFITYESSDESIATVNGNGIITAVDVGEAIIIAHIVNGEEDEVVAETIVNVVAPVEAIEFEKQMMYCTVGDVMELAVTIEPDYATNKNLVWDTSNEDVCYVNENGELVAVSEGVATIKATAENMDLSAYVKVWVTEEAYEAPEIAEMPYGLFVYNDTAKHYIVTENGQLWFLDVEKVIAEQIELYYEEEEIEVASVGYYATRSSNEYCYGLVLDKNGVLYKTTRYMWNLRYGEGISSDSTFTKLAEGITRLYGYNFYDPQDNACVALTEDGQLLVLGYNDYGKFGIGGRGQCVAEPMMVAIEERIVDVYHTTSSIYLLTEEGNVYAAGDYIGEYFVKIDEGVEKFKNNLALRDGEYAPLQYRSLTWRTAPSDNMISDPIYIKDGRIYRDGSELELKNVKDAILTSGRLFLITEDNDLCYTYTGFTSSTAPTHVVMVPIMLEEEVALKEGDTNLWDAVYEEGSIVSGVLGEKELVLGFNGEILSDTNYNNMELRADGTLVSMKKAIDLNNLTISMAGGFREGVEYALTIPASSFKNDFEKMNGEITVTFTYEDGEAEPTEEETEEVTEEPTEIETGEEVHVHTFVTKTVMPTVEEEGKITNKCECGEENETVLPKKVERDYFTQEDYTASYNEWVEKGFNTNVSGSAILNRLIDDDVTKWLRITAPSGEKVYGFGGNWWGTTNETLINHQIVDYNDFISLGDINEGEYLTVAPENTFPFVTNAYLLDEDGYEQTVVSNGKVHFVVEFNRDMDTEYGLNVYFGSTYPYADYEVYGEFADARTWVGETTLKTVIENGYQFIRVTNGRACEDEDGNHLKLYNEWARFGFEIDTTAAMAMMMQGYADSEGIHLEWMQDDYDTLAGYNVYRSTSEDGNYVRLNKTIIPSEENTYIDYDVEPGKKYYYTFTVVLTDVSSESSPAGKIEITAKDTMAPNVYHSPVYTATTGNKIIVSATVSDNIGIASSKLYYRVKGEEGWKSLDMTATNDKYTAAIPASSVTMSGVEYYIAAYDGVSYTYAGGRTNENPYEVTVYQAVENNAKGDVDGDGNITVLDALKLLRAIYDESLLTQEEFLRADIDGNGTLSAVEALRILQYANKTISSVLW